MSGTRGVRAIVAMATARRPHRWLPERGHYMPTSFHWTDMGEVHSPSNGPEETVVLRFRQSTNTFQQLLPNGRTDRLSLFTWRGR